MEKEREGVEGRKKGGKDVEDVQRSERIVLVNGGMPEVPEWSSVAHRRGK